MPRSCTSRRSWISTTTYQRCQVKQTLSWSLTHPTQTSNPTCSRFHTHTQLQCRLVPRWVRLSNAWSGTRLPSHSCSSSWSYTPSRQRTHLGLISVCYPSHNSPPRLRDIRHDLVLCQLLLLFLSPTLFKKNECAAEKNYSWFWMNLFYSKNFFPKSLSLNFFGCV